MEASISCIMLTWQRGPKFRSPYLCVNLTEYAHGGHTYVMLARCAVFRCRVRSLRKGLKSAGNVVGYDSLVQTLIRGEKSSRVRRWVRYVGTSDCQPKLPPRLSCIMGALFSHIYLLLASSRPVANTAYTRSASPLFCTLSSSLTKPRSACFSRSSEVHPPGSKTHYTTSFPSKSDLSFHTHTLSLPSFNPGYALPATFFTIATCTLS